MIALAIFFTLLPFNVQNSQGPPGVVIQRSDQVPISAPRATYKPDPQYTDEALAQNVEGTVIVSGRLGTDGRLHDPKVVRGLGFGLDQRAIE